MSNGKLARMTKLWLKDRTIYQFPCECIRIACPLENVGDGVRSQWDVDEGCTADFTARLVRSI